MAALALAAEVEVGVVEAAAVVEVEEVAAVGVAAAVEAAAVAEEQTSRHEYLLLYLPESRLPSSEQV